MITSRWKKGKTQEKNKEKETLSNLLKKKNSFMNSNSMIASYTG